MKKINSIFTILLISVFIFSTSGVVNAQNHFKGTYAEALAKAKKENKKVLIDFYATWCPPCKKMSAEVFPNEKVVKELDAKYVFMSLDVEKGEGATMAKKYGIRSIPTFYIMDKDGKIVKNFVGYNNPDKFVELIK